MEEIGWGQRLFNIGATHYFKEHNIQKEFSLHNLGKARPYVNEMYILICFYGVFSCLILPKKIKSEYNQTVDYFIPNWFWIFYFLPVLAIYTYISYVSGILVNWFKINAFHIGANFDESYFVDWRDQEPAELLLALGFLFFVLINKYRQKRRTVFEKCKIVKFAPVVLSLSLFIFVPFHMIHVSLSHRLYPYDHFDFGNLFFRQGKLDEAIAQYSEALRIDPLHAESYNNLGWALEHQGRINEAIDYYYKALRIKPTYGKAYNNIGNALIKSGRVDEALEHFSRMRQMKPGYAEYYNLGCALLIKGSINEAIEYFSKSLQIKPDNEMAHNNIGNAFVRQGKLKEAVDHYNKALQLNPDFADAHMNMGIVLKRQGRFKEAVRHFTEVLRIQPDNKKARRNLDTISHLMKKSAGSSYTDERP